MLKKKKLKNYWELVYVKSFPTSKYDGIVPENVVFQKKDTLQVWMTEETSNKKLVKTTAATLAAKNTTALPFWNWRVRN